MRRARAIASTASSGATFASSASRQARTASIRRSVEGAVVARAIVGAGSVVTRDVEGDALGVTRAEQKQLSGWAARFRERQSAKKGK